MSREQIIERIQKRMIQIEETIDDIFTEGKPIESAEDSQQLYQHYLSKGLSPKEAEQALAYRIMQHAGLTSETSAAKPRRREGNSPSRTRITEGDNANYDALPWRPLPDGTQYLPSSHNSADVEPLLLQLRIAGRQGLQLDGWLYTLTGGSSPVIFRWRT